MDLVRFINLDRHWADVSERVQDLSHSVLSTGICQRGPLSQEVEGRIAYTTQKKHCVTFANCSDALAQGLRNLQLPSNSEILVPEYTFVATINAIRLAGYRPVLVDVDNFYHINLEDAASKISNNTRVLLYVTLLGSPAPNDLEPWCEQHGLLLVEDAAQSFGSHLSDSLFSVLSFSPSKPCTSFGSGGALVTNDDAVADAASIGRLHGNSDLLGINSMMSTSELSAIQINLSLLEQHTSRRRTIANAYIKELTGIVEFPKYRKGSTYSKFIIKHAERDRLQQYLTNCGIQTQIHYNNVFTTPNCQRLAKQSLTLPNCAYMTDQEVERVIKCLKEF